MTDFMPVFNRMPEIEFPLSMSAELEDMTVDDRVSAILSFEVVGKDETSIDIKVNSITFRDNKREL